MTYVYISLLYVNLLCIVLHFSYARNCHDVGVGMYKSLGCTALSFDDDKCPTEYQCDFPKSTDVCYFKGKEIAIGEKVFPTEAPCNGECSCVANPKTQKADFRCQFNGCNMTGIDDKTIGPDCYRAYELGNCCSIGVKCRGKDEISTCIIDGEEVEEGRGKSLKNSCGDYCICTKEGPKCLANACGVWAQVHLQEEIRNYCAPVYLKDEGYGRGLLCCHHRFYCPNGKEEIRPSDVPNPEGKTCIFGNRTLNLGDTFNKGLGFGPLVMWRVKCTCRLPPFVTCSEETSQDNPDANVNSLDF